MTARSWKVASALAVAAALVALIGYGVQRQVRTRAVAHRQQELATIADAKLRQLTEWRGEREYDAFFFSRAKFVADQIARLAAAPTDAAARAAVTDWVQLLKAGSRNEAVIVYDTALHPLLSFPEANAPTEQPTRELLEQMLQMRRIVWGDLYLRSADQKARLEIAIPVFASPQATDGQLVGAIVVRMDPAEVLFPLLQAWPTPSRTAETLMVRRDGNDVLYLNELRHRKDTALRFRQPLDARELPAARVLRGELNTSEGTDYRGVPVVFVGQRVAGTRWALVTKVDREELYAAARSEATNAIVALVAVALATMVVGTLLWQRRTRRLLEQLSVQAVALKAAANGILITRSDGTIEWVNPAFTKLTGFSADEAIGRKPNLLKSGQQAPHVYRRLWETILGGNAWHGELINKRKDGSVYHEEMTITPVVGPRGDPTRFIAIMQDVSGRKHAEEQQVRLREELEQLVKQRTAMLREMVDELEHFSYSITHDMRAPLRAMNSYASMVEREFGAAMPAAAARYISRIKSSAARLDALIRDSLNYTKVLQTELPLGPVDLGPLLRGLVDSYPNLQPPHVEIVIEFGSLVVLGNEAGLTQCFANLLGNAVKFVAPEVKPHVRVAHETRLDPAGKAFTRVSVRDNGIGIPQASQQDIFAMFRRLHGQHEYPGTGIGLALVRKVTQRMGGTVGVSSVPGQGSEFWIEILSFVGDADQD